MFALLNEISFRHWRRSPLRSLLVILGVSLGVALYISTEAASRSMLDAFNELVGRVAARANLIVVDAGGGVSSELVASVAEVPGVAHAAANLELTTQAPAYKESLLVLGVDFLGDLHFLPFDVNEGDQRVIEDPLAFVNDPYAILIAKRFAVRHHLTKGSTVELLTSEGPKQFHVRGVVEDSGPAASFGGQVIVMFLDAAQVSFARGTSVDRIDVATAPDAKVEDVRRRLAEKLGPGVSVESPDRLGTHLRELVMPLSAGLALTEFVALLVGIFLVYNAVGIAVVQRAREIGLLRALGVTRGRTVRLLCAEAAALALPAVVIGLAIARSLARLATKQTLGAVNRLFLSVATTEPKLTLDLVLRGCAAGLVMALVAAWWPARRGASTDPAVVLRGSSGVERSRLPFAPLLAAGVALLAASKLGSLGTSFAAGATSLTCSVLGAAFATPALVVSIRHVLVRPVEGLLGIPGRLGLDYVERTLGRSTVNVLALMVAVSMSVCVGGWLTSFQRSVSDWFEQLSPAELTVTAGSAVADRSHLPLSAAAMDRIAKVPGVAAIQPLRGMQQQLGGHPFTLIGTDTTTFLAQAAKRGKNWPLVEGDPVGPTELRDSPKILLAEAAAHRLHLRVGDHVTFHARQQDLTFEVRGIVVDYTTANGSGYVDRRFLLDYWGDDSADAVSVFLTAGAQGDAVADGIRGALGAGIFATRNDDVQRGMGDMLTEAFSYARSVEWVTLLVALMGVTGTMIAAVLDRRREIGALRAIGATRRQVATSIVVEAGFLGFCAVVAGVALGVLQATLFLHTLLANGTGWHISLVFPWVSTARIALLAILTSMLAGGVAAFQAARSDVAGSVVYE
ncbi:MAG TPA: FtsX-like permease family protein [Polyangiaceae bacterium]|nr:FtsX-like permease family protein [Polyangiaceae bacterium]